MNPKPCPVCDGDGYPLGALGRVMHYRCRHCGMQFSRTIRSTWKTPKKAKP